MEAAQPKITRRHRKPKAGRKDTGKGERLFLAGQRFQFPKGLDLREVELRKVRLRSLWTENEQFCLKVGKDEVEWTYIALWAAERIRQGEQRVPYPEFDDILASFDPGGVLDLRLQGIVHPYLDDDRLEEIPEKIEDAHWREAETIYEVLTDFFRSVPWQLPRHHIEKISGFHERRARRSIDRAAHVRGQAPVDPKTPLVAGSFHEAVEAYLEKRRADFTHDGKFDGSGHHMLGLARDFMSRQANIPLAQLDFSRCQQVYDFWRDRPINLRTKEPLSRKHCSSHIGELDRFFDWLHVTSLYGWRRPADFDLIQKKVKEFDSDRPSINELQITTFSVRELTLLYKHALPNERLKLLWCLNCSHGAAEIGRVEWEDLFLHRPHPWLKEGLKIETTEEDSWCGFLRPKTDVLGWWWLWPETVGLVEWWKNELQRHLGRNVQGTERMMITTKGTSVYRDSSKNGQSGFANDWKRLLNRVIEAEGKDAVQRHPFGTLRDQLSDWLGCDEAKPVIASVALAHGIPHKGDKLLYKHYSNKPWKHLFEAQREFRQVLKPIFDESPDPLKIHDPVLACLCEQWEKGERKVVRLAKACGVSTDTIYRKLQAAGLATKRMR